MMQKVTPFLASGRPRICCGCSQPFIVRQGRAEAIVGADNRLYCHRTGCEEQALVSHIHELQQTGAIARAA